MLREREGAHWVDVINYLEDRTRKVRTTGEVTRLLELLGEDRRHVTGLSLAGLNPSIVSEWLDWPGLAWFTRLDLSDCFIKKEGLARLLACPHLGKLEHLSLVACDIGKAGIGQLKSSDQLPALRSLDLSSGDHDRTRWDSTMLKHLATETKGKPHGATLRGLESLKLGGWDCSP